MSSGSTPPGATTPSPVGLATYFVLILTSGAFALLAAPQLLASVGLVSHTSLQGWMTLIGMWLAVPLVILIPATAILSLVGFVRGPPQLRLRLGTWWAVGAGGGALAVALAQTPGFNPYLGTPQPAFGLGDALLALSLGLSLFLAARWFVLALRASL